MMIWIPMMRNCFLLLLVFLSVVSKADNSIRIIPDSTNQFARFEMSRTNTATYKITFTNEKGVALYKTTETITATPKIISIPWKDFSPGFYYMTAKNKRETVKLLFVKKE